MNQQFYINEIERAKPVLKKLLQWNCGLKKTEILLGQCDIHMINTIQLLMYMGRDIVCFNIKQPEEKPIKWFISWANYMEAYCNADKKIEIDCILGKREYQKFISAAVSLMGIML